MSKTEITYGSEENEGVGSHMFCITPYPDDQILGSMENKIQKNSFKVHKLPTYNKYEKKPSENAKCYSYSDKEIIDA